MLIADVSVMKASGEDRDEQSERMYRSNDLELARLDAAGVPPLSAVLSDEGTYELAGHKDYVSHHVAAWPPATERFAIQV